MADRSNNAELFTELIFPMWEAYIKSIVKDKCDSRDYETIGEAYQESLIILYKGVHTFDADKAPIKGWISMCVRRHIKKFNEKMEKHQGKIDFDARDITTHHISDTENKYNYCENNYEVTIDNMLDTVSDELLNCYNKLEGYQKEIFEMRYFDDLQYKEIVNIFQERGVKISVSGIKTRIAKIRHPIIKELGDFYASKDY